MWLIYDLMFDGLIYFDQFIYFNYFNHYLTYFVVLYVLNVLQLRLKMRRKIL